MSKLIITLLLSIMSLFGSIEFEKDYKKALELSKLQNIPLFIMISSPECPECNYMKKNIFTQNDVSIYIKENFIPFEFDVKDKNIPKQMEFWGIPRFYLSMDGENIFSKKMGGMKKEQFLDFIKGVK